MNIKWLKAKCPICNTEYEYTKEYRPNTCNKFECIYKYLHPELAKRIKND